VRAPSPPIPVVGLDPTAGTWSSRMTAGPRAMWSVALLLRSDGTVTPGSPCAVRHRTNAEFLDRVGAAGAVVVAIDGPCATAGPRVRPDWSGWDPDGRDGTRDAERALAAEGHRLFWTTRATVERFDGASRWIARSLRLFEEGRARLPEARWIEVHPHAAFRVLAGGPLPRKDRPEGRRARLAVLAGSIGGLPEGALPDHDAVDAAVAALVAARHAANRARALGSPSGGGRIWLPSAP